MRRPAPFATSYMIGRENKRTNIRTMCPVLKNNAAAGYNGPVDLQLLQGLLIKIASLKQIFWSQIDRDMRYRFIFVQKVSQIMS